MTIDDEDENVNMDNGNGKLDNDQVRMIDMIVDVDVMRRVEETKD